MGETSFLRFVPTSSANIPIHWTKVPEASKRFLLDQWGNDYSDPYTTKKRPLPATIDDLAKMFHDTKFFGYIYSLPKLCTLLLDISEFGLAEATTAEANGLQVGPRFYMKWHRQVWFVLFTPGQRDGIIGHSPNAHVTMSDEGVARDKALAEDFDSRLCEDLRRWGLLSVVWNKVAGWEGIMLKSILKEGQMFEAAMELPTGHPAREAMIQKVMISLSMTQ